MQPLRTHRWLSVITGMLLLFTTATPALVRMTCLSGGHSVLSVGQAEDCCPEQEHGPGATFAAACCDSDAAKPVDHLFESNVPGSQALTAILPTAITHLLHAPSYTDAHRLPVRSRPPPLLVLERLSLERSFLI